MAPIAASCAALNDRVRSVTSAGGVVAVCAWTTGGTMTRVAAKTSHLLLIMDAFSSVVYEPQLRCRRWGHAPLRSLLEGVGQLEEARFAASHASEADAVGCRPGVERLRERRRRAVGDHPEWHNHSWVSRLRGEGGAGCRGEQQRIELMHLHRRIDPIGAGELDVLGPISLVARPIGLEVHLVRVVELRLAVLDRAASRMRQVEVPELGQRLNRGVRSERGQPSVEVALHPVLEYNRTVGIFL